MKTVLFCQNPYAFGILNPIKEELIKQGDSYLWYVPKDLLDKFTYKNTDNFTSSIKDLIDFKPDAHFAPGNEIPHYLRGVKAHTFHGFAAEKKRHFHIRGYYDLYLTQGPFFTEGFKSLQKKYQNFEVKETGWSKLDTFYKTQSSFDEEKSKLLNKSDAKHVILYAPTFSPSLTSAPKLINEIQKLAQNPEYLILIKFHDLMDKKWVIEYETLSKDYNNIKIERAHNILKYLMMADLLISDTSSVIYEFLLLDKPVITIENISNKINWDDISAASDLSKHVDSNLTKDPFKDNRKETFNQMHPYNDGGSSKRMIDCVKAYIEKHGVPEKRRLSFLRRRKINKMFGKF